MVANIHILVAHLEKPLVNMLIHSSESGHVYLLCNSGLRPIVTARFSSVSQTTETKGKRMSIVTAGGHVYLFAREDLWLS